MALSSAPVILMPLSHCLLFDLHSDIDFGSDFGFNIDFGFDSNFGFPTWLLQMILLQRFLPLILQIMMILKLSYCFLPSKLLQSILKEIIFALD